MPSRNTLKIDIEHTYYHVYARGASKQAIFLEQADFFFFTGLFARYLSSKQAVSKTGVPYPQYGNRLNLNAYCLMGNHFHCLIYQVEEGGMAAFMRSLMTSYSRYFNLKYKRTGSLFESRYKASRIDGIHYLEHISRYIHLNPRRWKRYPYSSLSHYLQGNEPEWLKTKAVLDQFQSRKEYVGFVADYEANKLLLEELKHELADT